MALPAILGYVHLALVPGIGSLARDWLSSMPSSVKLVPVDYAPSAAIINVSASSDGWWEPRREPGGPGDFIEVMALRLLAATLPHALAAERWAIAGHSSGGTVIYRGMDLILDLMERPEVAARGIAESATKWLPAGEATQLRGLLDSVGDKPLSKPLAAISLEGSLMQVDVEGWAADLGNPNSGPAMALQGWERAKQCTIAADIQERCEGEDPPRHMQSVRRWLEWEDGPPFAYVAGCLSGPRTQVVFKALENLLHNAGVPPSKLEIHIVPRSRHPMNADNPQGTAQAFERILLGSHLTGLYSKNMNIFTCVIPATHTTMILTVMGVIGACAAAAFFSLRKFQGAEAQSDETGQRELNSPHEHPLLE
mmetsp:Transcript_24219/g.53756  ORF Transcript_24219/g.53756 Transcript_24219/m.53756 type:complete len:367 (-) Transcript_24219:23-1123(-)